MLFNVCILQEAVALLEDQGRLQQDSRENPGRSASPGGMCGASGLENLPLDLTMRSKQDPEVWDPPPRGAVEQLWREGHLGDDSPMSPQPDPLLGHGIYSDLSSDSESEACNSPFHDSELDCVEIVECSSDSEEGSGRFSPIDSPPLPEEDNSLEAVAKPNYMKNLL